MTVKPMWAELYSKFNCKTREKQSRIKERHNVGTLNPSTGRVIIRKKYFEFYPGLGSKIIYFENNKFIEKTEEIPEEYFQEKTKTLSTR